MSRDEQVSLNGAELEEVKRIAKRDNKTIEEATTQLLQAGLARRVKKRTGKGPAKLYPIRRR